MPRSGWGVFNLLCAYISVCERWRRISPSSWGNYKRSGVRIGSKITIKGTFYLKGVTDVKKMKNEVSNQQGQETQVMSLDSLIMEIKKQQD